MLVIEIILPKQGGHDLMEKFMKYFEYGVPSCWLVNPLTETIHVYSPDWTYQLYGVGSDKIKDKSLNIEIDFQEVFS